MWILPKSLTASSGVSATADFISDLNEFCQACESSLLARSKPTRSQTWSRKLKAAGWMRFLSGRILKPSHVKSFTAWWTSSVLDTLANHSVPLADEMGPTTRATSGHLCGGQLRLFAPDTASLKTWKGISASDCVKSLPNWLCSDTEWRTAVANQRGEYSRRLNAVRRTIANGCSYSPNGTTNQWATICANKLNGSTREDFSISLPEQAKAMARPSPTVADVFTGNLKSSQQKEGSMHSVTLPQIAQRTWKTPQVNDAEGYTNNIRDDHQNMLTAQVKAWPTPRASERGSCEAEKKRNSPDLRTIASLESARPTPTNRDYKGINSENSINRADGKSRTDQLPNCVHYTGRPSSPDPDKGNTNGNRQGSLQLSADWVEALMDVPAMWTDCGCSETAYTPPQPQKPL